MPGYRTLVRAIVLLACLTGAPIQAAETPAVALDARLAALVNAGEYDAARRELSEVSAEEADRRLLEGRILKANNALDEAIHELSIALRLRPDSLEIRRELAHTLFLNERYSDASYHLERLRVDDPDPQLRAAYRDLQTDIDARRVLSWDAYFSIEPSTNINRGSERSHFTTVLGVFEIDDASRSQSGFGFRAGVGATLNRSLSQQSRVSLRLSQEVVRYSADQTLDNSLTRITASHVHAIATRRIVWSAHGWHEKRNDGDTNNGAGLGLMLERQISPRTVLNFLANTEYRAFVSNPSKTGWANRIGFGAQHRLAPDKRLGYGLWVERNRPDAAHTRYNGYGIYLRV